MALSINEKARCPKCGILNVCYIDEDDPNWFENSTKPEKGGNAGNEQTADEASA